MERISWSEARARVYELRPPINPGRRRSLLLVRRFMGLQGPGEKDRGKEEEERTKGNDVNER